MKPSPILRAAVERVLFNADMQRFYGEPPRLGPEVWSILKDRADTARRQLAAHNVRNRRP